MRRDWATLLAAVVLIAFAVALGEKGLFSGFVERTMMFLSASSARAYSYGSRHFDAQRASDYDIEEAAYFFAQAEKIDPDYPLLQHQLARLSFLEGDFATALARINAEISTNPRPSPSSYYVRGLIEGYMGNYKDAAKDYEKYLSHDPHNWAAINDYAWVLLKAGRLREAASVTSEGLTYAPENPWLLNTNAIALFEIGQLDAARKQVRAAAKAVSNLSETQWLIAYPGNDPRTAEEGIRTLQESIIKNMHAILLRSSSSSTQ